MLQFDELLRRCETISLSLVFNSQFHVKYLASLTNQNARVYSIMRFNPEHVCYCDIFSSLFCDQLISSKIALPGTFNNSLYTGDFTETAVMFNWSVLLTEGRNEWPKWMAYQRLEMVFCRDTSPASTILRDIPELGGGLLTSTAFMERLRLRGCLFQALWILKDTNIASWRIWKGRRICPLDVTWTENEVVVKLLFW